MIVGDAEALRAALELDTWAVLGQAPRRVRRLGCPRGPQGCRTHDHATRVALADGASGGLSFSTHAERRSNIRYFADVQGRTRRGDALDQTEEFLPSGERLSSRRFRTLGMGLGGASRFSGLHYLQAVRHGGWHTAALRERVMYDLGAALSFASPRCMPCCSRVYAGPSRRGARRWRGRPSACGASPCGFAFEAGSDAPVPVHREHIVAVRGPALVPLSGSRRPLAGVTDFRPSTTRRRWRTTRFRWPQRSIRRHVGTSSRPGDGGGDQGSARLLANEYLWPASGRRRAPLHRTDDPHTLTSSFPPTAKYWFAQVASYANQHFHVRTLLPGFCCQRTRCFPQSRPSCCSSRMKG